LGRISGDLPDERPDLPQSAKTRPIGERPPADLRMARHAKTCRPQDPFNLPAAMALWAGLRIDLAELHAEVLVVAARPEPQASGS
jgi:hypothetical protein